MLFNPLQGSFYLNNFFIEQKFNFVLFCIACFYFKYFRYVGSSILSPSCALLFTFAYLITYLFNHLFIYLPTISLNYIFLTTLTVFFVYYGFNLLLFHEWIEISFIVWRINGHFKSYTM